MNAVVSQIDGQYMIALSSNSAVAIRYRKTLRASLNCARDLVTRASKRAGTLSGKQWRAER